MKARVEDRFEIMLRGQCRDNRQRRSSAEITELSANGCKVRTSPSLLTHGTVLWVKLGNRDFLEAEIRWSRGDTAGLLWRFELHPSIVAHIYAEHSKEVRHPPAIVAPAVPGPPLCRTV